MGLIETHSRADHFSILSPDNRFEVWESNRGDGEKGGGGLALLYKKSLQAHRYSPTVPGNLKYIQNERQWLLITTYGTKIAYLNIYCACQSLQNDAFLAWNSDLFHLVSTEALALREQGFMVVAMGDYNTRIGVIKGLEGNTPDTNRNYPLFMDFMQRVNLVIVNALPVATGLFTRFANNSGDRGSMSLLDYCLIDDDKVGMVESFEVSIPFTIRGQA